MLLLLSNSNITTFHKRCYLQKWLPEQMDTFPTRWFELLPEHPLVSKVLRRRSENETIK